MSAGSTITLTNITHAGDDRLFVTEDRPDPHRGRWHIALDPFLDIKSEVAKETGSRETGLLGLVFHPNYKNNGYFYLHYNVNDHPHAAHAHFARFKVSSGDAYLADPNSEVVLMEFTQPQTSITVDNCNLAVMAISTLLRGMGEAVAILTIMGRITVSCWARFCALMSTAPAAMD